MINSFCQSCTAGNIEEIKNCQDRNCPFYKYRRSNMKWQKRKRKKIELCIPYDGSIA
jgi:hypothetical protein